MAIVVESVVALVVVWEEELVAGWVEVLASPKAVEVWGSRCLSRSSSTAAGPATTRFPMSLLLWSNHSWDRSRATATEAGAARDSEGSMW